MMDIKIHPSFLLFWILVLFACDSKKAKEEIIVTAKPGTKLAIICDEGNFQQGNADISIYNFTERTLQTEVFRKANNRDLGDIVQDAVIWKSKIYLTINNSQKVEILDKNTYTSIGQINGFYSPRNIIQLDENRFAVSEYYANSVKIIQNQSMQITKDIFCPGWHDEMLLHKNKIYVTSYNRDKLYIIDMNSEALIDSIKVILGGASLCLDKNNDLWLLCANITQQEPGKMYRINTTADTISKVFNLPNNVATKLRINSEKDRLYWISQSIYSMPIDAATLPIAPYILSANNTFYGINIDPETDELWISDAVDYVQKSTIMRYTKHGDFVGQFKSGINSGKIIFHKE